jgi:hypothetical protein
MRVGLLASPLLDFELRETGRRVDLGREILDTNEDGGGGNGLHEPGEIVHADGALSVRQAGPGQGGHIRHR